MVDKKMNEPAVPVPVEIPHDRVSAFSLNNDGTIAGNNPELIGDKDAGLAATKEQFRQFAVSAVDQARRAEVLNPESASGDGDTSDAKIDALRKEHQKAEAAADKAAEALVNERHNG